MIGQTPLAWPEILNHSVAIGVVLFFGFGLAWLTKRLFGGEGIITKTTERNSATMEKYGETLVQLKDLSAAQQTMCDRHACAMGSLDEATKALVQLHTDPHSPFATIDTNKKLDSLDGKVSEHTEYHENMHGKWGVVNPREFRVPPVLDAILHIIDTAEDLAPSDGGECVAKLRSLRKNIEAVKEKMKQE